MESVKLVWPDHTPLDKAEQLNTYIEKQTGWKVSKHMHASESAIATY